MTLSHFDPKQWRPLNHPEGKIPFIQHDYEYLSRVYYKDSKYAVFFIKDENGNFELYQDNSNTYDDWYLSIANEKLELIVLNRHLIDKKLILSYRWAIREGYNHQLDKLLKNRYDRPRHKNTIEGVQGYIKRIEKASEAEMKAIGIE